VTLRLKLILYLLAVHVVFAAAVLWYPRENRIWLLALEGLLIVSAAAGVYLLSKLFGPLDLIRSGVQFLEENDFTTRFLEVGQREMDELVRVYNRMADHLREERIRVREQHHFLEQIVQASPAAILIFDFDGRVALTNPSAEKMLHAPAAALAGRKLAEIGTPFTRALEELPAGSSATLPLEGNRRVKCWRSQFLDRGFRRDFLMIEELTAELRRSERAAYEKIIRMMSHEINNSIGASNSLLESCLNYKGQLSAEDREDFETALSVAISRAHHLNAFVKSYADVIRLPAPELHPCDVKELLEDIAYLLSAECRERSIEWRWAIETPPEPVRMDKNQIEQVFLNVLRNAVESIGHDGCITVRMGRAGAGRAFVSIADTGAGILSEVRANLFTPFYSTKENGRGIGLTLVQEILTRHKFDFTLENGPAGGAEFTVWF
jgi:two-component system, NtrC family, nitrogen regulation sensor histidine kinase NtrY